MANQIEIVTKADAREALTLAVGDDCFLNDGQGPGVILRISRDEYRLAPSGEDTPVGAVLSVGRAELVEIAEIEASAEQVAAALRELIADESGALADILDEAEAPSEIGRVESFEEAGLLTRDAGFVVQVGGREFQVTIVRR